MWICCSRKSFSWPHYLIHKLVLLLIEHWLAKFSKQKIVSFSHCSFCSHIKHLPSFRYTHNNNNNNNNNNNCEENWMQTVKVKQDLNKLAKYKKQTHNNNVVSKIYLLEYSRRWLRQKWNEQEAGVVHFQNIKKKGLFKCWKSI